MYIPDILDEPYHKFLSEASDSDDAEVAKYEEEEVVDSGAVCIDCFDPYAAYVCTTCSKHTCNLCVRNNTLTKYQDTCAHCWMRYLMTYRFESSTSFPPIITAPRDGYYSCSEEDPIIPRPIRSRRQARVHPYNTRANGKRPLAAPLPAGLCSTDPAGDSDQVSMEFSCTPPASPSYCALNHEHPPSPVSDESDTPLPSQPHELAQHMSWGLSQ